MKATVGRFSGGEEGERSTGGYGPCGPGRTTVVSGTTSEAIEETTPRVRSRAAALAAAIADASPLARSSIWDAKEEEAAVALVFVVAAGAEAEAAGAEAAEEEKRRRRVRGRRKAPREAEYHGYGRRFDLAAPAPMVSLSRYCSVLFVFSRRPVASLLFPCACSRRKYSAPHNCRVGVRDKVGLFGWAKKIMLFFPSSNVARRRDVLLPPFPRYCVAFER